MDPRDLPQIWITETAEILAAGLSRMLARQSREKSLRTGEFFLDTFEQQSGHPTSMIGER